MAVVTVRCRSNVTISAYGPVSAILLQFSFVGARRITPGDYPPGDYTPNCNPQERNPS